MNFTERLEAFWAGEKPDRIPYTIYQNEWKDYPGDPAWQSLYDEGLIVTWHTPSVGNVTRDVEYGNKSYVEDGKHYIRKTITTPVGEICSIDAEGWCQKHWLETEEDYRVMTYVAKHTDHVPLYEEFIARQKAIAPSGVPLVELGRSPMQVILVDYVGLENFAYHLVDFEDELMELYEALMANYRKKALMVAEGPGRFVSALENFTAETMGPVRFEKYHMPVYRELYPMIQSSGKIIGTHYDGKLQSCSRQIAEAPMDLIESLTEPPEGDMMMEECRKIWPDKLFWCNINVSAYNLPEKELQERVERLAGQGSVNGAKFAFEVSEHIPKNWRTSMPIVLRTLNELSL
jgi:hypothetical protein